MEKNQQKGEKKARKLSRKAREMTEHKLKETPPIK